MSNRKREETSLQESTKNMRHIWMINHHAILPSKDGGSGRHLNLATALPEFDWTASLIVASTRHPSGTQAMKGRRLRLLSDEEGVPTLRVRSKSYEGSTVLRWFGMVSFAVMVLLPRMTRGLTKPDVVMGSTVHPLAAWAAGRLARRHRVPFIYEIRDVWPETLVDLGLIGSKSVLQRILRSLDRKLIGSASLVVSPLPFVDRHIAELGFVDKPFLWVPNGFDAEVRKEVEGDPVDGQELCEEVVGECADREFTFMYLGSHGAANDLEELLEAFSIACQMSPDLRLKLRLVGEGRRKADLERYAATLLSGDSISFEDRIPKAEVIGRARESDCLVATLHDFPVYRFGVSLNKFFAYLAAGRPVLIASSAPNNPILEADAGMTVPARAVSSLADAMVEMASTPRRQRLEWGANGERHVRDKYNFRILARKLSVGLDVLLPG